jgi:4-hydroxymandelate oxidase
MPFDLSKTAPNFLLNAGIFYASMERMEKIINLSHLETLAKSQLTKMAYDFIAGGADDEVTLHENEKAWKEIQLLPRVLWTSKSPDLKTTALGAPIDFPVLVAPMGFQSFAHVQGEVAAAEGTSKAGSLFVLSTMSTKSIEQVADVSGPKWFQLYIYKDRGVTKSLVERAVAAGYKALCLTVDTPIEGRRERDKFNQFSLPSGIELANFKSSNLQKLGHEENESALTTYIEQLWDPELSWADVEWLAKISPLPMIIKGVLSEKDALISLQHGVSAIIVSNHGGRQLDTVPSTAQVISGICEAIQDRCEVYVDGGIRRGTDVLKALALGARAVLLGRPVIWGLTLGGAEGVEKVLLHLRDELSAAMQLCGCKSLADISKEIIWSNRGIDLSADLLYRSQRRKDFQKEERH